MTMQRKEDRSKEDALLSPELFIIWGQIGPFRRDLLLFPIEKKIEAVNQRVSPESRQSAMPLVPASTG